MTTELEAYLKAATRGLWGKKKLEVREELENHVLERAHKHELEGFKQPEAIQKVLEQIGPANIVSRGMIGVHTMPNILRTALTAAFLTGLGITGLNQSLAQVTGNNRWPIKECADPKVEKYPWDNTDGLACEMDEFWINIPSLRKTLTTAGVTVNATTDATAMQFLTLRFPNNNTISIQQLTRLNAGPGSAPAKVIPLDNNFVSAMDFFRALRFSTAPASLEGWDNIRVGIGNIHFQLKLGGNHGINAALYSSALRILLEDLLPYQDAPLNLASNISLGNQVPEIRYGQSISYKTPTNTIMVALSYVPKTKSWDGNKSELWVAQTIKTDSAQVLSFKTSTKKLEFAPDIRTAQKKPGSVILLRFTGRLDLNALNLEIIAPKSVR
jgi:hypothetical protein